MYRSKDIDDCDRINQYSFRPTGVPLAWTSSLDGSDASQTTNRSYFHILLRLHVSLVVLSLRAALLTLVVYALRALPGYGTSLYILPPKTFSVRLRSCPQC